MSESLWPTMITGAVGTVGILATALTNRSTMKWQRDETRERRLWDRKADLYEELLDWATHGQLSRDVEAGGHDLDGPALVSVENFLRASAPPHANSFSGRIEAWAPQQVRERFEILASKQADSEAAPDNHVSATAAQHAYEVFVATVRADLGTGPLPRSRSHLLKPKTWLHR